MPSQPLIDQTIVAKVLALAKRKKHPFVNYKPGPTALRCHKDTKRHRVLSGANRSGKTYAGASEIAWYLTGTHPYRQNAVGATFILCCLSRDQAHMVWRQLLLGTGACRQRIGEDGMIPHWEIADKKGNKGGKDVSWDVAAGKDVPVRIGMKNGNQLYFRWHGDQNNWKRMQGVAAFAAFLDEAGDDTHQFLTELELRMPDAISKYGPDAGSILWMATDTTANADLYEWMRRADEGHPQFSKFIIGPMENPGITKEAREIVASSLSEEDAAIRVWGTQSATGSLRIYPTFNEMLHVSQEFVPVSAAENIIVVYDPGLLDDTGLLFATLGPDEPEKYIIRAFYSRKNASYKDESDAVKKWLGNRKMRMLVFDQSGGNRREKGPGQTIVQQFAAGLKDPSLWVTGTPCLHPSPCKGQVDGRIRRVTTYLGDKSNPPKILIDKPTDDNGLRKFIQEMVTYRTKQSWDGKKFKTDAIFQKDNEGPDCLGYLCNCALSWCDAGRCLPKDAVVEVFDDDEARLREQMRRARIIGQRYSKRGSMQRLRDQRRHQRHSLLVGA